MTDSEKIFLLRLELACAIGQLELAAKFFSEDGHPALAIVPLAIAERGQKLIDETKPE